MKICWNNLEKLKYNKVKNYWYDKYWNFYIEKICKHCKKPFLGIKNKGKYCNNYCSGNTNNVSEKIRKKIGKSNKGKKRSESLKQLLRKKALQQFKNGMPEETKKKMSEAQKGEKGSNWKGGIACEPYCDFWLDKEYKESIKERDGYQCLNPECNKNNNKLCLHHINYNKKDCRPKNLITICNSCNLRANKDRIWHEVWYNTIIYRRYGI